MIGDRYQLEVTVECFSGPDVAVQLVGKAVQQIGWLWPVEGTCEAWLLPGESHAFVTGERPVAVGVRCTVETMHDEVRVEQVPGALMARLRGLGTTVHAVEASHRVEEGS